MWETKHEMEFLHQLVAALTQAEFFNIVVDTDNHGHRISKAEPTPTNHDAHAMTISFQSIVYLYNFSY